MGLSSLFAYPDTDNSPIPDDGPFLADWGHAQWSKFFPHTQTQRYSAGDWVIASDVNERAVYLVALGQVELLAPGLPSGQSRLALVTTGGIVGVQGFLDGFAQPIAVRALAETETVRLSFDAFEVFAVREPTLARELLLALGQTLSFRLRRLGR